MHTQQKFCVYLFTWQSKSLLVNNSANQITEWKMEATAPFVKASVRQPWEKAGLRKCAASEPLLVAYAIVPKAHKLAHKVCPLSYFHISSEMTIVLILNGILLLKG